MASSSASQMIPEKPIDIHFGGCFTCKIISLPDCSMVGRAATKWLDSAGDLAFYIIKLVGGSCNIISLVTCWNCVSVPPDSTSSSRVGLAVSLSWYWKRLILLMKLEIKNQSDDHTCQRKGLVKHSMMISSCQVLPVSLKGRQEKIGTMKSGEGGDNQQNLTNNNNVIHERVEVSQPPIRRVYRFVLRWEMARTDAIERSRRLAGIMPIT